ncbi:YkuJ family protein [Ligilactobacillus ceti]|uniref:DUF1797 domain-containing protein n=1 Tax=Ligilactobacillus ceti DSM 22408 TaxID=1122146 RepID=A0A0R2KLQ4_9LACO|nr:YkuJ family protein [Ligilactobacillus ceti]KRN90383.1 hypothetical protein IV53_GL000298 [Ligilactobacillus ceti DSM 22408]
MDNSKLVAVITRLDSMVKDNGEEVVSRRFEHNGTIKAVVYYDPTTTTFTLEDPETHQSFEFDNIDLIAIEIFELLDD